MLVELSSVCRRSGIRVLTQNVVTRSVTNTPEVPCESYDCQCGHVDVSTKISGDILEWVEVHKQSKVESQVYEIVEEWYPHTLPTVPDNGADSSCYVTLEYYETDETTEISDEIETLSLVRSVIVKKSLEKAYYYPKEEEQKPPQTVGKSSDDKQKEISVS